MSRYAVGDLQGFLQPLHQLLSAVDFKPEQDELWMAGDLVNRGPDNADILRYLGSLPTVHAVLGNHDLHLLAVAQGVQSMRPKDTFEDVLQADDRNELLKWLRHRPLLHLDHGHQQVMTHAGIPPCWTVAQATALAREMESVLRDPALSERYFSQMYGNLPNCWEDELSGTDRWRLITNYFTRMRFIGPNSELDFDHKDSADAPPEGLDPWFSARPDDGWQVIFGHWAALNGETGRSDRIGLDTGYGWGGWLTLCNLDTGALHQVNPDGAYRTTTQ